jgi:hypothetical protein
MATETSTATLDGAEDDYHPHRHMVWDMTEVL